MPLLLTSAMEIVPEGMCTVNIALLLLYSVLYGATYVCLPNSVDYFNFSLSSECRWQAELVVVLQHLLLCKLIKRTWGALNIVAFKMGSDGLTGFQS